MAACISARNNRSIIDGFIFHSARGVQYTSNKMTNLFSFNRKVTQIMSRKGNCWDNAVAESLFKSALSDKKLDYLCSYFKVIKFLWCFHI
jgi:putative transposase